MLVALRNLWNQLVAMTLRMLGLEAVMNRQAVATERLVFETGRVADELKNLVEAISQPPPIDRRSVKWFVGTPEQER